MNNFLFFLQKERRCPTGVRWHKKVKKVNDSIIDLDKAVKGEHVEYNVQTPVVDLDVEHYWNEFIKSFGVENPVEIPPQSRGVEVEDLDEPQELKLRRLLTPKTILEVKSQKLSLFNVRFYNHLYVLVVTTISNLAQTIKKEITGLLRPVKPFVEYACGDKIENLKKHLNVKTGRGILTVSDLIQCSVCRALNEVQLRKIFDNGSTVKVNIIDVTIVGSFGDLLVSDELEEIIKALEPLKRFSVGFDLEFKKCEFCSK